MSSLRFTSFRACHCPTTATHDIAIVVAPDLSVSDSLTEIGQLIRTWPKPVLNLPQNISSLDRDRLHVLMKSAPGVYIPTTARLSRKGLSDIAHDGGLLRDGIADGGFPLIVRPIDCHAGRGLAKLEMASTLMLILHCVRIHFSFPHVDYKGVDGLFRKYRIVFVDGRPYPCHMAIRSVEDLVLQCGYGTCAHRSRKRASWQPSMRVPDATAPPGRAARQINWIILGSIARKRKMESFDLRG